MGSYAYVYLNNSLLLEESLIAKQYRGISDRELTTELQGYREHCLKSLKETRDDVRNVSGKISCLGTSSLSQTSKLKQAALYLDEAVIDDPIFKFTDKDTPSSKAVNSYLGLTPPPEINRAQLSIAAQSLIDLRPFVVGNYVKIYPISYELERTEVPLLYSENGFEDSLPKLILDMYKSQAIARTVKIKDGNAYITKYLQPSQEISIYFKELERDFSMIYRLNEANIIDTSEDGTFTLKQYRASLPTKEKFEQWVKQSINQTAMAHFSNLKKQIAVCNYLGSMFGTDHSFENELLNLNIASQNIQSNTLNCMMKMDVQFLDNVSTNDLMSIRNNDGEAFHIFRKELEKGLRAARNEQNPTKVAEIIEDTQHELFEVQMSKINPKIKNLRRSLASETVIISAGLALSVATSGITTIASILAGASFLKTRSQYKSEGFSNPSHFLWKVKQKEKKVKRKR